MRLASPRPLLPDPINPIRIFLSSWNGRPNDGTANVATPESATAPADINFLREIALVFISLKLLVRCHESCGASRYKHTLFPEPTIQSCLFLTSFCNINRFTEMFQHCSSVQPLNPPALPPAFRTSYGGPSFATTLIPRKLRRALLRCYAHPAQATAGEAH